MSAWGEEEKVAVALVKGSLSAAKDANLQKEDFHLHLKHTGRWPWLFSCPEVPGEVAL